jgi:hypothetical protein
LPASDGTSPKNYSNDQTIAKGNTVAELKVYSPWKRSATMDKKRSTDMPFPPAPAEVAAKYAHYPAKLKTATASNVEASPLPPATLEAARSPALPAMPIGSLPVEPKRSAAISPKPPRKHQHSIPSHEQKKKKKIMLLEIIYLHVQKERKGIMLLEILRLPQRKRKAHVFLEIMH